MSRSDRRRGRRWTRARYLALMRASGPRSVRFRTRLAILTGAVAIGLVATLFAAAADAAGVLFAAQARAHPYAPLIVTPLLFVALVWLTRRIAPLARGSGIP